MILCGDCFCDIADKTATDSTNTVTTVLQSQDTSGVVGTSTTHGLIIATDGNAAITIDTSQNATFAGTIGSGAITSTGAISTASGQ